MKWLKFLDRFIINFYFFALGKLKFDITLIKLDNSGRFFLYVNSEYIYLSVIWIFSEYLQYFNILFLYKIS